MPILGLGLAVSGIAFLGVAWLSWSAGFPAEVALLRGLIAFMAINFVAYLGELVVATAPPVERAEAEAEHEDERAHAPESMSSREPAAGVEPGREPIPLRPELEERRAA